MRQGTRILAGTALAVLSGAAVSAATPIAFGTTTLLAHDPSACAVVADVTGDGRPDVVLTVPQAAHLTVHPGNGNGTFGAPFEVATSGVSARRVIAARLNDDVAYDLVIDHGDFPGVDVLLSDGQGGFTVTASPASATTKHTEDGYEHAGSVAAGNLDDDPLSDLVLVGVPDPTRPAAQKWDAVEVVPVRASTVTPAITSITPPTLLQRGTARLEIAGTGFTPGATVDFGPGVTLNDVGVMSSNRLLVNVTVARIVEIPPVAGWRVRRNVSTWTSPRGQPGPKTRLKLDARKHTFKLVVDRAEFASAGPDLFLEISLGAGIGSSVRTWRTVRGGLSVP